MLKITGLKVFYGDRQILKGIDLELTKGEILAVVGESGTGKTTLALTLLGLCAGQAEGKIYFQGRELLALPEKEMRKVRSKEISIVFQDASRALNPLLTAGEQIIEPILEHQSLSRRDAEKRLCDLLHDVGLNRKKSGCYPHQLSGGEKQKVMLAIALANNPLLLILDEPTAAADAVARLEIIELCKKIAREMAVIVVTHDLALAGQLSQKTAVLYSGRIVEMGETSQVLRDARHPYTRGLVRSFPDITTTKDLQGIPGKQENLTAGCAFHSRCTQKLPRCQKETPELLVGADGRKVACHRGGIITFLEIKNLSKRYGELQVLKGINLKLQEGETLAVVGQSGSGKTTLAKCIMGLEKFDEGEIIVDGFGKEIWNKNFYRKVQLIFQNHQECISHRLNVLDAVLEPLNIQKIGSEKERLKRAREALQDVQLPVDEGFLKKYPHHLSGGEIQRVAIARALVLRPKLLIADEPTSALDASVQAKIVRLLLQLQEKRGLTLLFITHDLALARKISDKVAVMLAGVIVEEGRTAEVLRNPRHPYTIKLLQAAPRFH